MPDMLQLPDDVREWVREVFGACNHAVAAKMSRVPTAHETSLDLTFIERLSRFATPIRFESEWVVRLDAHYLGGGRHFGEWEVADVGLLVMFRRRGALIRTKVALLQSKRLYPDEQGFSEDEAIDYMVGFGRLMQTDEDYLSIIEPRRFTFTKSSHYKAFRVGDRQFEAIRQYEEKYGIPVHYLLYHPLILPHQQVIPISAAEEFDDACEAGCRVIAASTVNSTLGKFDSGYSPSFDDIRRIPSDATAGGAWPGWKLEDFVAVRVLDCHEGYVAADSNDQGLFRVFNRRSGPIAAAVAITFDAPG
jgi:hypothetical protein